MKETVPLYWNCKKLFQKNDLPIHIHRHSCRCDLRVCWDIPKKEMVWYSKGIEKSEHPNHSEKEQNGRHLEFMFWLSLEISLRITIPGGVICRSLIASSIFIARTRWSKGMVTNTDDCNKLSNVTLSGYLFPCYKHKITCGCWRGLLILKIAQ